MIGYAVKSLSRIVSYDNTVAISRAIFKTITRLGIHEFDIFGKIEDKQHIAAINHGFEMCGKHLDAYVIGAAAPRKVVGIFYYKLFENEIYQTLLENWGMIRSDKLKRIKKYLANGEIIGIAPEGPTDQLNPQGELGAAWIAKITGISIIPTKIISRKGYTTIETRKEIQVSKNSTRKDLKEITDEIISQLN